MGRTRQSKRNISLKASHQKTSPKPDPDPSYYTTKFARKDLPPIPDDAPIPLTEAKMIEEIKQGIIRFKLPSIFLFSIQICFIPLTRVSDSS